MSIRIAIADDHPMIIKGLQRMLEDHPQVTLTNTYYNGPDLLEGLQESLPDVLLLDIQLPGKTGDELAPVIMKKYPDLKILVLTNFDSTLYVNNMIRYGAHGYLLKTTAEDILLEAIEAVYQGSQYIDAAMKEKMEDEHERMKKEVLLKSTLTAREKEVLRLIINGHTNQEIADKLFLGLGTAVNYRNRILMKLEVKNTASLVKKALQLGLVE